MPGLVTLSPTKGVTAFPGVLSPSMAKSLKGPGTVFHSENIERFTKMLHGGARLPPDLHGADATWPLCSCDVPPALASQAAHLSAA